jgi:hypothetical protein
LISSFNCVGWPEFSFCIFLHIHIGRCLSGWVLFCNSRSVKIDAAKP